MCGLMIQCLKGENRAERTEGDKNEGMQKWMRVTENGNVERFFSPFYPIP